MQTYCQLDPQEQTSVKFESNTKLFTPANALKMLSVKWQPSYPGEMS